jgi:hypothetical protein
MISQALQMISQAEKKWLDSLCLHDLEIFSGIHLPSHDHTHHLRVWQFARELVMVRVEEGKQFSQQDLELLILAVFFHDTGMSRTQHARHGIVSREFCEAFIRVNQLSEMAGITGLLEAVEKHDDKEYTQTHPDPASLLTLLNLADDLDAFGLVGVYRYAEIYLMRGISLDDIPGKVLLNLDTRYNHLIGLLPPASKAYAERCRNRFLLTRNFYEAAVDYLKKDKNHQPAFSIPLKVLEEIADLVIMKKHHPLQLAAEGLSSPATRNWWLSFEKEWNQYKSPGL